MKKILTVVVLVALMVVLTGCNKTIFDTTYTFDEAIVRLADDTVLRGEVQKWDDYEGDQIQVKIDGVTYLVHAENITLIAR